MRADGSGVTKKTMESKRAILTLRCSLALLPLAGATYLLTMFRTSGFGPDNSSFWVPLGVAFVYAGIPAALPFLGLSWRAVAAGALGVCLVAVAVSEAFCRAQEMQVIRKYGATPYRDLAIRRWWPFEHHDIYYTRRCGWSGCD